MSGKDNMASETAVQYLSICSSKEASVTLINMSHIASNVSCIRQLSRDASSGVALYLHIEVQHHETFTVLFQFLESFSDHLVNFLNKLRERIL